VSVTPTVTVASWPADHRRRSTVDAAGAITAPTAQNASQIIGATRYRSDASGWRVAYTAYAPASPSATHVNTAPSAVPCTSGGNATPSTNDANSAIGRSRPPRTPRAVATNGARRRRRNHADPRSTAGIENSATGRSPTRTLPKEKSMNPRAPTKSRSTPRYASPCTATSDATTARRLVSRSSSIAGAAVDATAGAAPAGALGPVGAGGAGTTGGAAAVDGVATIGGAGIDAAADPERCETNPSRRSRVPASITPLSAASTIRRRA
jgi:hypothetical protein